MYIQKDKSRPVNVKWITFKVIYLNGANKKQHLLLIAKEAFTGRQVIGMVKKIGK